MIFARLLSKVIVCMTFKQVRSLGLFLHVLHIIWYHRHTNISYAYCTICEIMSEHACEQYALDMWIGKERPIATLVVTLNKPNGHNLRPARYYTLNQYIKIYYTTTTTKVQVTIVCIFPLAFAFHFLILSTNLYSLHAISLYLLIISNYI